MVGAEVVCIARKPFFKILTCLRNLLEATRGKVFGRGTVRIGMTQVAGTNGRVLGAVFAVLPDFPDTASPP